MDTAFALDVVDRCEYAVVAFATQGQTPYCIPLTIARQDDLVYFHCARRGKKIDLLRNDPRVCLSCVGDTHRMEDEFSTEYECAVVFGTASEVTEAEEKIRALRAICERHTPSNMDAFNEAIAKSLSRTAVWRVRIEEITGKRKKYDANGEEMKYGRME